MGHTGHAVATAFGMPALERMLSEPAVQNVRAAVRTGGWSRRVERHRGDAKAGRKSAGMEPLIPYGDDERLVRHGERARQMHGIGAPERKVFGEISSVTADRRRQLDRPGCAPKLGPALFCLRKPIPVEVMVPVRGSERGPDLGIGQPARYGRVASVPQRNCELRPRLLNEQLHERTGVEVDQWHLSVVARSPMGRPADVYGAVVVRRPRAFPEWSADQSHLRPSTGRATGPSLSQGDAQPGCHAR